MVAIPDMVARIRQPEYTGANRCAPCTVLNVFIAVVIGILFVWVSLFWVGVVTFAAFVVVIYVRGYLVPGTPAITERYFPERVLRRFGKEIPTEPTLDQRETTNRESGERGTVEALAAASVVTRRANEIDLSSDFRDAWRERIHLVQKRELKSEDVRAMYDADTITSHSPTSFVVDRNKSVRWVSEAALVADVAAATELEEWIDWATFDKAKRDELLTGLRLFLQCCPCDGSLSIEENRIDPCCQKAQIVVQSVCESCDAPIIDAAVVDSGEDVSREELFLR
jgi:hypothetical protein